MKVWTELRFSRQGGQKNQTTQVWVPFFFPVKCNKKENFTLEIPNVLLSSQMQYYNFYTVKILT